MMNHIPFVETDPHADVNEFRARMDEYGYLFLRGILPLDEVLTVRRDVLEVCREHGWLDETHDLMDAFVKPGIEPLTEGKPAYMAAYRKILKLPRFHNLPCDPALMRMAAALLNFPEPFVHPRRIGRVTFPNYAIATTPAHQDHFYIRGSVDTYSCWVPLGDVPIMLGGLAIWPRSHKQGFIEHTAYFAGAVGGRGVPIDESKAEWHVSDFRAGDALFFHSFTIHKALPNLTGDRLRLSTDNRYQRPKDAIDPGALRPHFDLD